MDGRLDPAVHPARRIMDRGAIGVARRLRLDRPPMPPKPAPTPKPPQHRVYPRRAAPPPPPRPAVKRVPAWTRQVPPDRSFPRS